MLPILLKKVTNWLDDAKLLFEEAKRYFKKGMLNISGCQEIFSVNGICEKADFEIALKLFTTLKQDALNISPVNGFINLIIDQVDDFQERYKNLRADLTQLLLR